jgi:LCP family protein required for cell wall assembly
VTTASGAPLGRSAFTAAFLSFLFPGLGQAYAGRGRRAALFALPAFALALLAVGLLVRYGLIGFGLWLGQTSVLSTLAFVNAGIFAYRLAACVDAYRLCLSPTMPAEPIVPIALAPARSDRRRLSARRSRLASMAGLAAVVAVLAADHAIVGYWDLRLHNFARDLHSPIAIATDAPNASEEPDPVVTLPPQMTFYPEPTQAPWDMTGRLNILLVGVDTQANGFRTDSMIVVSLDPEAHQVAMFSIPRDTYGLPMPPRSRLSTLWGSSFNYKLNALWKYSDRYRDLFPGGGADALKQALGYLYFGDQKAINYYVLVDFQGFQKVVDTLGGVTIDVPAPIVDDGFPGNDGSGLHKRVYIPAGIQHMSGDQALTYARSRKASPYYNDYNRSARQQQILVALQQQADANEISAHLGGLMDALSQTVHTDLPEGPDILGALIDEARHIRADSIKTYAFAPSVYGYATTNAAGSVFIPDVAAIRKAVQGALAGEGSPDRLQAAIGERAPIFVENGTGTPGQDTTLAAYLASVGFSAQASTAVPPQLGGTTRLLSVNGAADEYPATFEQLEALLGLSGLPATDPNARVQAVSDADVAGTPSFIIVTGTDTPALTPLPSASPAPS